MNHFDPEQIADDQREIASHLYPLIGPYDSGDPDVLAYHLLLMKLAGIDGVIVDWYGLQEFRDYAIPTAFPRFVDIYDSANRAVARRPTFSRCPVGGPAALG